MTTSRRSARTSLPHSNPRQPGPPVAPVLAARRVDRPLVTPMGIEERVEHDGYSEQSIVDVERQVIEAARLFANVLGRPGPADWSEPLSCTARSHPNVHFDG